MPAVLEGVTVLKDGLGRDGATVPAGEMERTLLARLLKARTRAAAVDELLLAIWPALPRTMARNRLRNLVHRVNAKLDSLGSRLGVVIDAGEVRVIGPGRGLSRATEH